MKSLCNEKVLIGTSSFSEEDTLPMDCLREAGCAIITNPFRRRLTKVELLNLLGQGVTGLIAGLEPLSRDVLEKSKLKVISRCGSGLSNIDLQAAEELEIKVCRTPEAPVEAVAELTLGVMLCLFRDIADMNKGLHEGKWPKKIGCQLAGKTVAIIGFGRIGRKVASLLKPFNVKIIAVDPNLCGEIEDVKIKPLNKALEIADVITIHASGEEKIIGEDEFKLIKLGAFLLNAARGGLIDEAALVNSLEEGRIKGAWLDAFLDEPYSGPLTKYPNVLLTPHIGSYTAECRRAMEMEAVENLVAAFRKFK